ncbi:MAG: phosphatase PAP2 family protein [Acidimicrobiales bacterium]
MTSTTPHSRSTPPTGARWWGSHLGGRLLREAALVVLLYALYKLGRTLSRDEVGSAFANADQILSIERFFGIANERSLQRLILDNHALVILLNRYYATVHFPVTLGFLIFTYVRHPQLYRRVRWLFVLTTASGLLIHVLYPLAPPRLLPGFVDTITVYGPRIYSNASVTSQANQFAAMPSLHFAWAVLVAYGIVRAGPNRWRWLAVAHPVMTVAAIVLTANHFWLDAVLGGVLVLMSLWVVRSVEHRFSDRQAATVGG